MWSAVSIIVDGVNWEGAEKEKEASGSELLRKVFNVA